MLLESPLLTIDHFPLGEVFSYTSDQGLTKHKHDICSNEYKAYTYISIQTNARRYNTIQCTESEKEEEKLTARTETTKCTLMILNQ